MKTKETLVLLHGYGGSGALFYPVLKQLSSYFDIVLVDIIGMAASSRPNNFDISKVEPQESIDYFVEWLETWRKKVKYYHYKWKEDIKASSVSSLKIKIPEFTDFILAGHSFGGYVIGHYSLKYHQHIKKLLLLSPIGYRPKDVEENHSDEELEKKFRTMLDHPKWFIELARFTWKNQISPFGVNRFLGRRQSMDMFLGYVQRKWMPSGAVKTEHL